MPGVWCCRTRRLGALSCCVRIRGGSALGFRLVAVEGEVVLGVRRDVEANEIEGLMNMPRPRSGRIGLWSLC